MLHLCRLANRVEFYKDRSTFFFGVKQISNCLIGLFVSEVSRCHIPTT